MRECAGMTEHIVHRFDDELHQLHGQVIAMAKLVLAQTRAALALAVGGDTGDAAGFADKERAIDNYEVGIDDAAVSLIARRGPVASDLRTIMAMSKMASDLERIGDEAVTLTELADEWSSSGAMLVDFGDESEWAASLLQQAVDVLEQLDVDQAVQMESDQAKLVEPFRSTISRLAALDQDGNASPGDAVLRALAVRCIERIGDHTCNLCEHVVYLGRGIDVRHQSTGND
jgi:phosphate transport system protein